MTGIHGPVPDVSSQVGGEAVCRTCGGGGGADYTYGLYIYAYPVQQTLIWATGIKSVPLHIALSLGITLGLAMVSWHWLEEPALRVKARLQMRSKTA